MYVCKRVYRISYIHCVIQNLLYGVYIYIYMYSGHGLCGGREGRYKYMVNDVIGISCLKYDMSYFTYQEIRYDWTSFRSPIGSGRTIRPNIDHFQNSVALVVDSMFSKVWKHTQHPSRTGVCHKRTFPKKGWCCWRNTQRNCGRPVHPWTVFGDTDTCKMNRIHKVSNQFCYTCALLVAYFACTNWIAIGLLLPLYWRSWGCPQEVPQGRGGETGVGTTTNTRQNPN